MHTEGVPELLVIRRVKFSRTLSGCESFPISVPVVFAALRPPATIWQPYRLKTITVDAFA